MLHPLPLKQRRQQSCRQFKKGWAPQSTSGILLHWKSHHFKQVLAMQWRPALLLSCRRGLAARSQCPTLLRKIAPANCSMEQTPDPRRATSACKKARHFCWQRITSHNRRDPKMGSSTLPVRGRPGKRLRQTLSYSHWRWCCRAPTRGSKDRGASPCYRGGGRFGHPQSVQETEARHACPHERCNSTYPWWCALGSEGRKQTCKGSWHKGKKFRKLSSKQWTPQTDCRR